jgi:hypothetical protein
MRSRLLPVLFSLTLFVSAALLFLVQPLVARRLLPLLGGTPAVWTSCMLFFQAALLAGYGYAHLLAHRFGTGGRLLTHLAVLAAAALVLPIALTEEPREETTPLFWILGVLARTVGPPFVALAASAPLLQRWFAGTGHPSADDPYFLYAASNVGSLLALLAYPFLIEPHLTLQEQSADWALGYGLLTALTAVCAWVVWRSPPRHQAALDRGSERAAEVVVTNLPGRWQPLRWLVLAFVPASLMLSVTTYLSTDIAAIPLLWVVPLALYLLTFALAFARRRLLPHGLMVRLLPAAVILVTVALLTQATEPLLVLVVGHLALLFVVAMVCHGELARLRPPAEQLTGFYLCLSVGGVLGGLFNGLLAPLVFPGLWEYPLVLVAACLVAPPRIAAVAGPTRADLLWPLALASLTAALVVIGQYAGLQAGPVASGVMFAVPAVLCYTMLDRPLRFGLGVAALFLGGALYQGVHGRTLHQERSFFGVHRVVLDADGKSHILVHGNTVHGRQWLDPARKDVPLMYYHPTGPAGRAFEEMHRRGDRRPVAVVGLGAGSLARYGQPGQELTFYEIDPAVIRIASDPEFFTFLRDSPAKIDLVAGDARLTLARAPAKHYGVIVIDAFSSDAIPLHLLTREALAVYRSRLADDGVLLFHISNRYVDLAPVLGDLAGDAGLLAQVRQDLTGDVATGKLPSHWVLLTPSTVGLMPGSSWLPLRPREGVPVWTDDYSNLAGAIRWNPFRVED